MAVCYYRFNRMPALWMEGYPVRVCLHISFLRMDMERTTAALTDPFMAGYNSLDVRLHETCMQ